MPTALSAGLLAAATLLLGACGQKGPLRLPPERAAASVAASPAPAAASAAAR